MTRQKGFSNLKYEHFGFIKKILHFQHKIKSFVNYFERFQLGNFR